MNSTPSDGDNRQQALDSGGGAYGPTGGQVNQAYEPAGESRFVSMFTTDFSRSNGQSVSYLYLLSIYTYILVISGNIELVRNFSVSCSRFSLLYCTVGATANI